MASNPAKAQDDIKIVVDSKAFKCGGGDDMSMYYDGTKGVIDTSLVAASDLNVACGTDKTVVLNETVWDDLRVSAHAIRPGTSAPSEINYDVNAGGITTKVYEFAKNNTASFIVQLPHKYKQGTDIYVHIHWTPGPNGVAESGNTVGWKVEYSWANIGSAFGSMSSKDLSDACTGTNHLHEMTSDVVIDGHTAAKNISSMLLCNVTRTDTGADDTWSGTATGALPILLEVDFHFEIDTMGSRQIATK